MYNFVLSIFFSFLGTNLALPCMFILKKINCTNDPTSCFMAAAELFFTSFANCVIETKCIRKDLSDKGVK